MWWSVTDEVTITQYLGIVMEDNTGILDLGLAEPTTRSPTSTGVHHVVFDKGRFYFLKM